MKVGNSIISRKQNCPWFLFFFFVCFCSEVVEVERGAADISSLSPNWLNLLCVSLLLYKKIQMVAISSSGSFTLTLITSLDTIWECELHEHSVAVLRGPVRCDEVDRRLKSGSTGQVLKLCNVFYYFRVFSPNCKARLINFKVFWNPGLSQHCIRDCALRQDIPIWRFTEQALVS